MVLRHLVVWPSLGKIAFSLILPKSDQWSKNLRPMIFHTLLHSYSGFVSGENFFGHYLAKFSQNLTQFLAQFLCSCTSKWDLAKCIGSPSFIYLGQEVQKIFHSVCLKNKGQFPCDLAAFKVTNPARDPNYHQDWGQMIKFYITHAISKWKGGKQIKRSDCISTDAWNPGPRYPREVPRD